MTYATPPLDSRSGLLSRVSFDQVVERALAGLARRPSNLAVLLIDLDSFESVKQRFGRALTNVVRIAESNRLMAVVRPSDTVARAGDNGFLILCTNVHRGVDARRVGQRVIDATERPFDVGGDRIALGACVGIAVTRDAATNASIVFQRADLALCEAKRRGSGRVAIASPQ